MPDLKGNGADSFSILYQQYAALVYSIAYSYMRNREDAEDMTEEAFVRLYEHGTDFPEPAQAKAWLAAVTRNLCINELKKRNRQKRADELPEDLRSEDSPQRTAELNAVMEAIGRLPEEYRLPLVLFAVEGYSVHETAEILNLNESTVRTRVARAREIIRKETGVEQT